jgi:hypothetical protein
MRRARILLALLLLTVAVVTGIAAADHASKAPSGADPGPASSECPAMQQKCPAMEQACPGMRGGSDPAMMV